MTETVKSEHQEARELIMGEVFMVNSQKAIYWAYAPNHGGRHVYGIRVWCPTTKTWISTSMDLDTDCWISMEIEAQNIELGDYIACLDGDRKLSHWSKVEEVQYSMGGVTLKLQEGSHFDKMGLEEDRKVRVVRK